MIDSPPLLPVADALALAPKAEGVVLVVDAGRTRSGTLRHAFEGLERVQASVLGVVLNKLSTRAEDSYYYYYGKGYGYGARPDARAEERNGAVASGSVLRLSRRGRKD